MTSPPHHHYCTTLQAPPSPPYLLGVKIPGCIPVHGVAKRTIFDSMGNLDEPASLVRDVSQWEAYPTDSGFIANQDRPTIAKSSTLPHDSALRVTSPAAEEGSMQQTINELTALCTSLQRQHSELL
nr:hypothetical protein [Tanacetum cinerariifolium]